MDYRNGREFKTKDFYLAVYLVANDLELIGVNHSNPHKVLFIFADIKTKEKLVENFLLGRASVKVKAFIAAIQALKQFIHSNA